MSEPNFAWANFLWHERLRCIYAVVPKSGTTSIKRWFIATNPELQAAAAGRNVHDLLREHVAMNLLDPARALELLHNPKVYRFTFVRNPWTRLVSGFLDKVVGAEPVARRLVRGHYQGSLLRMLNWRCRRLTGSLDRLYQQGLTFREFVDALAHEEPQRVNPHFRLQSRILQNVPLDFIGRIENFSTDFAVVQMQLGDRTSTTAAHKQQYTPALTGENVADWPAARLRSLAAFPQWRRFYTPEIADRVRQIFADDFAAYGYSRELSEPAQASQLSRAA